MKIKTARVSILILLASVFLRTEKPLAQADSLAKTKPQAQADSQAQPAIRSDMESIAFFVGHWQGLATITVNGKVNIINFDANFSQSPDGKAIYEDELIIHPEFGTLKRQDVWTYDEKTNKLRIIRTDYDGKIRIYSGGWVGPNHFQFQTVAALTMGPFVETIDYRYIDKNRLNAYLLATLNGEVIETDTGYFRNLTPNNIETKNVSPQ